MLQPKPALQPDAKWGWAPRRKPGSAFIFYRLRDGSAWVSYTMVDEQALAPWPLEEGWDEALPPSVGFPDQALGVYIGRSLMDVTIFLNQRQTKMRVSTDPKDFEGL